MVRHRLEGTEAGSLQGVGVDIDGLGSGDVLEQSHGCVLDILAEDVFILLALGGVHAWVLENASVSVRAFGGVLNEVLTHGGQVLLVKVLLGLKFMFAMRKAAALLFVTVVAGQSAQPEFAQLGAHLCLPLVGLRFNDGLPKCGGLGHIGLRLFELSLLGGHVSDLFDIGIARVLVG